MNKKIYAKKLTVVIISQFIMATGGAFLFCSGMGNDPFGVINDGISKAANITYGQANIVMCVSIVLLCLAFHRKNLSLTTLLTAIIPGSVLDFYIEIINSWNMPDFIVRYIYPFLGCFIIGTLIACYLSVNTGASCLDNLILLIADMVKKEYNIGFYICSAVFLAVGIPLGGVWGYATVVTFFGTGNVVKFMSPFFNRTVAQWANKQ